MGHRDFDAEAREASGEPVTFTLGGILFICRHPFPVGSLLQFATSYAEIEALAADSPRKGMRMMVAIDALLRSWITPDQHDAWSQVVATSADLATLERVVSWVVREVTGRPSSAPSSSPVPVDGTGPSSTGA